MPTPSPRRAAVWLSPEQLPLIRQVADAAALSIVVAGTPARGKSGQIAGELGVPAADDLRAALATADCDLFLIADPGDFGAGEDGGDAGAVHAAQARGVRIAALEPIPATPQALVQSWRGSEGGVSLADGVPPCGLLSGLSPFREPAELLDAFGPVRSLSVQAWSRPEEGSLGAQMYSALDLVRRLTGEPETIDAAYVAPQQGSGVHALPGESLRALDGDMTANCRFADGRCATVFVSSHAGRWGHAVTLLGRGGRAMVVDGGVDWVGLDGVVHEGPKRRRTPMAGSAQVIVDALTRLLDPGTPGGPSEHAGVLAMCHAALLSCRTGQGESPATIRRMAGA